MSNPERKTNAQLVDTINQLKAQSRDTGSAVWRDVALRLSKSRKNWAQPNLSRVSRYAPEGATILVPGKLLGSGELTNGHTIAAYSVSNGAREKIEAAGGRIMTYGELMTETQQERGCYPWLMQPPTCLTLTASFSAAWPPPRRTSC